MEVEPRSQSPAANSETELDFAKRNRSGEDLDKADDVERDLESSSYSLDVGGVLHGRPSSNSDNSVQCKVDLHSVLKGGGSEKSFFPRKPKVCFGQLGQVIECSTLGSTFE